MREGMHLTLPNPKEALLKAAEVHDTLVDTFIVNPIKQVASMTGLPEPPTLPRAQDIVSALPDLELPNMESIKSMLPSIPAPQVPKLGEAVSSKSGPTVTISVSPRAEKGGVFKVEKKPTVGGAGMKMRIVG